jgi:O-acetylhomoserine/O-acetylserine sulfhydrylase-like pyridoxal-dependent enzyme
VWQHHQNKAMHRCGEAAAWSYADAIGEIYTVRYDTVNAMLLNEFLKEHRKVEEQHNKIQHQESDDHAAKERLRRNDCALTLRLGEQASQIQKVSAQVEASKTAPQVVNNP